MNWLDLLLGRLAGGVDVLSEIFSFDSIRSRSISVRPVAANLVWIVCGLKALARARG